MNPYILIAQGYRRISAKHHMIARIDREDWREYLAKHLHRDITDMYVGCWEDYYRRVLSKDVLTVDESILVKIPTSCNDRVGYIKKEGTVLKYYVWNPNNNAPSYEHSSKDEAIHEANRLGQRHKGQTFRVLELVVTVNYPKKDRFKDLNFGDKFKQSGRTLVKIPAYQVVDSSGNVTMYNAIRVQPNNVSGWASRIGYETEVERV